jgi:hypothetical protein
MSGFGPGFPHSGVNFLVLIFSDERLRAWIPSFRRALYTVGLLLRYFDFTLPEIYIDLEVSSAAGYLGSWSQAFCSSRSVFLEPKTKNKLISI